MCKKYNKKHRVLFEIDKGASKKALEVYHSIKIYYYNRDGYNSLNTENGSGGFSLYLEDSYICLDFDIETKRVSNFGGMFNLNEVKDKSISPPKEIANGILIVKTDYNFISGSGWRIKFKNKMFYDNKSKILLFGDYNCSNKLYKVMSNLYIQLSKKGEIDGVVLTNINI